jgi:hypothetical protein
MAMLGAALGAMARGDAGAYAIAAAGIGGWMIWPTLKGHLWRGLALIPPTLIGCYSFFGSGQTTQGYGGDTPLSLEGGFFNLLDILVVPFGNLGLGRMGSLGWLDVAMPAATWASMAVAAGAIVVAGLTGTNFRSGLAAAGTATLLIALPLYMLQKYGFVVGQFVQPRYLLPLLIVLFGVLTFGSDGARATTIAGRQAAVIATCITIAHSGALYATLQRYTSATKIAFLGQDTQWWWHMPIGPVTVWVAGSIAFGVAVFVLFAWVLPATSLATRPRFTAPAWATRTRRSHT